MDGFGREDQTAWVQNWWLANKEEFPSMAACARDYLGIPGAEVDIERLFSLGREILGLNRHSMKPETMRALVLLKDEQKRRGKGQL